MEGLAHARRGTATVPAVALSAPQLRHGRSSLFGATRAAEARWQPALMDRKRLQVEFEITTVDGEHGRRLAALQAEAILDVLRWWSEHSLDVQRDERGGHLGCGSVR